MTTPLSGVTFTAEQVDLVVAAAARGAASALGCACEEVTPPSPRGPASPQIFEGVGYIRDTSNNDIGHIRSWSRAETAPTSTVTEVQFLSSGANLTTFFDGTFRITTPTSHPSGLTYPSDVMRRAEKAWSATATGWITASQFQVTASTSLTYTNPLTSGTPQAFFQIRVVKQKVGANDLAVGVLIRVRERVTGSGAVPVRVADQWLLSNFYNEALGLEVSAPSWTKDDTESPSATDLSAAVDAAIATIVSDHDNTAIASWTQWYGAYHFRRTDPDYLSYSV